jgi:hypothetical protein
LKKGSIVNIRTLPALIACGAFLSFSVVGCEEGAYEETGEEIDEAIEETEEELEDVGDDLEDAGDELGDDLDDTGAGGAGGGGAGG